MMHLPLNDIVDCEAKRIEIIMNGLDAVIATALRALILVRVGVLAEAQVGIIEDLAHRIISVEIRGAVVEAVQATVIAQTFLGQKCRRRKPKSSVVIGIIILLIETE